MTILAGYAALVILTSLLIFHVLVILQILPSTLVWGSRLKSTKEMYWKQSVAMILTLVFIWIVIEKINLIEGVLSNNILSIGLWIMSALFALSTLGNLFSKQNMEKYFFSITSLVLLFCCLLLIFK